MALCEETRPDVIFHSAAHKHVPMMQDHPVEAISNNFFGTVSIADAASATGCDRFVMISTDKAVNPTSIMGATKRLAELYVQHMNQVSECVFRMVRFGNVLASSGSVLPVWADQIRHGGPVTVTHPEMMRYFMTIPEAAALVIQAAALDDRVGGEVMLLDMGEPICILDLAKRYIAQHGLEPVVVRAGGAGHDGHDSTGTLPIVFTGIRPGEKLFEELSYNHESIVPSSHPGIAVWQMEPPTSGQIGRIVESLSACVRGGVDAAEVVRALVSEMSCPVVADIGNVPTVRSAAARAAASAA
jgi:FlaA1/EpsC-like NDP-sugar epimerase